MDVEKFKKIEVDLSIDSDRFLGVYYWDLIRYGFWRKIIKFKEVSPRERINFKFIKSLLSLRYLTQADVLILRHPRRIKYDGKWIDKYSYFIESDFNKRSLKTLSLDKDNFEKSVINVYFLEFISKVIAFITSTLVRRKKLKYHRFCKLIGFAPFSETKLKRIVVFFIAQRFLYFLLLKIINPKLIFLVVSSTNEAFISAAKKLKIDTFELQHGSPGLGKLNYDYSNGIKKNYFPDFFLSFTNSNDLLKFLPIKCENIFELGFAYLTFNKGKILDVKPIYDFLILSQPDCDEDLASVVEELTSKGKSVLVRVHPQYPLNQNFWVETTQVSISLPSVNSIYSDFGKCRKIIGCYSTALYEASFFEKPIFLLTPQKYPSIQNLLGYKNVHVYGEPDSADSRCNVPYFSEYKNEVLNIIIERYRI